MGWLKNLKRFRDERHQLIQLRHGIDRAEQSFREKVEGLKHADEEYQYHLGEFFHELDMLRAEIGEIETAQMQRSASEWRVPIPARPFRKEEATDLWEWHDPHERYYLSENGLSRLRREVYQEWEMWSKPWLSWAAIAISLFSLAISVLKP
jgi:hypothetical protein